MFEHTVPASWFPRCAIFDCDGVLLDSETAWNRVQRELFNLWNIPFSDDLEEQLTGLSAHQVAETLARLSYTGDPNNTQEYAQHQHNTLTELARIEADIINAGVDLVPGAQEFLSYLGEHMPVAVASNSTAGILDTKMHTYGYAPLVRTWVSCDDVPHGKPAPDIYREAARRLGFAGPDALTIEDSPAGAQAARDAGTKVLIYVPHGDFAGAPRGFGHFDTFTDPQLWRTARDWVARLEDSAVKASTTLMTES